MVHRPFLFFFHRNYHNILHCYEVSNINTINKIKQTPEIIDGLLDNLAKDYSRIFRIEKALYSSF